jgi:hypothetical protein
VLVLNLRAQDEFNFRQNSSHNPVGNAKSICVVCGCYNAN